MLSRKPTQGRLGLGSYRGRYLWLAAIISLLLLASAYIGQLLVRQAAQQNTSAANMDSQTLGQLHHAGRSLHQLRAGVQSFILDPVAEDTVAVEQLNQQAMVSLQKLGTSLQSYHDKAFAEAAQQLLAHNQKLYALVEELVRIRLNTAEWLPASQAMVNSLIPENLRLRSHLQSLQQMLEETPNTATTQVTAHKLMSSWLNVTGELRLMVANRFGVFDTNALDAMQARVFNVEQHVFNTRQLLEQLAISLDPLDDPLLVAEYEGMVEAINLWHTSYRSLRLLLDRDDWRRDVYLLHHSLDPKLQELQALITDTRQQVEGIANTRLQQVLDNSAALATTISAVAIGVIFFFLVGYLAFQQWLLRPIEHISQQLKQEAQGTLGARHIIAPVEETRALVEAFEEMHMQVKARENRLDFMAHHDPLTGLPNRVLFREQLNQALNTKEPHFAVLFLDLDRFKQINDSHGHLIGDRLLVQVAGRLRAVFRAEDTVARLSGDEFAVLLKQFGDREELSLLGRKVVEVLSPPFNVDGRTFHSSASVGLAMAPEDGNTADQLIQHADAAMYHAKASGRAGFVQFTRDMVERSTQQLAMETELHTAVAEHELELYLQPVVQIDTGQIHGYECLLRWVHPQRGIITPSQFLPALEDIGLLQAITDWMLDELAKSPFSHANVISINLPAKLLHNAEFAQSLEKRLRLGQLNARNLIVEITEDSFEQELNEASDRLHQLQALGARIALDDFGTGQSSLSHLRAFPFDLLKIDRSFVRDIIDDVKDATLVKAIIVLAETLGIDVVGEGVETTEQLDFLQQAGCQYAQGYLYAMPAPLKAIAARAASASPNTVENSANQAS